MVVTLPQRDRAGPLGIPRRVQLRPDVMVRVIGLISSCPGARRLCRARLRALRAVPRGRRPGCRSWCDAAAACCCRGERARPRGKK